MRATTTSTLALRMTGDALAASATEETQALVSALAAVTADLHKVGPRGVGAQGCGWTGFGCVFCARG